MGKAMWHPVKPDGATWTCAECKEQFPAQQVIAYDTPNGDKGIMCWDCVDPNWMLLYAEKGEPV